MKRVIEEVIIHKLETSNYELEIKTKLTSLKEKYPDYEWDFEIYAIQFVTYVCFKGKRIIRRI